MSTNFRSLRNIRKRPGAVPKEKEKYEAIEQALQKLAREGLIVDTGRRRGGRCERAALPPFRLWPRRCRSKVGIGS